MAQFQYKVSLIIPVYNREKMLKDCLDSVAGQTISPKEMEVLLIDDGSTDNSLEVLRAFAKDKPNVKVISKENGGPSKARNCGIENASGKYLMYLDSDDTISPETVKCVTDFFDKHYQEVDLVTYNEVPVIDGEEGTPHYRYQTLLCSGVYDLSLRENAFITQTRISVCVKNMPGENIMFDTELNFRHEDQKYCSDILMKKMKIGYCDRGLYRYLYQPDSLVRTYYYAYYIFEMTIKYWEDLFASFGEGKVPAYYQAAYLNDLSWKTINDILLPYHYEPEKLEEAKGRIIRLLDQVEDWVILRHPNIDPFHRAYWISEKHGNDIKMTCGNDMYVMTNRGLPIFTGSRIEINVARIRIADGKMHILAFVKSGLFNFLDKPGVQLIRNRDVSHPVDLPVRLSAWSYYRAKTMTNRFWLFETAVDIKKTRCFEFRVGAGGEWFKASYYFPPEAIFCHQGKRYVYYQDGMEFKYDKGVFFIDRASSKAAADRVKALRRRYKSQKAVFLARNILLQDLKKFEHVWLYYDCKGVEMDNGYYQFAHDFDKKDGMQRYYVINEENFEEKRKRFPSKYHSHMIRFGSRMHRMLYLRAEKIITAFIEKENYWPFTPELFAKYADIASCPEIVYLQHGVLHAHVPWKYSRDRLRIDRMVISTHFERENLISQYDYTEESLIPCGMPRYDFMSPDQVSKNAILYAPSWRKYLIGRVADQWVTTEKSFAASDYFRETQALLNSEKLHALLEKYDMVFDFKLHPIFERYRHLYSVHHPRVRIAASKVNEEEYKVFMTDFSSYSFDFAYLKRAMVYFFPDMEMVRAGMNDYRELDLPWERAFGELTTDAEGAVAALGRILENGGKPLPKWEENMEHFFLYKDNHQRDRLYEALMGRPVEGKH